MNSHSILFAGMLFTFLTGLALVLFYLQYRRRLTWQELRISRSETEHQRELLNAVIRSQENERQRIGMNLHDEVGAALSSLRLLLQRRDITGNDTMGTCKTIIDRVIEDVRNVSHDLSPIRKGAYEFTDALEDRCEAINRSEQLRVDMLIDTYDDNFPVNDQEALALYRVVSELLSNTVRHAKAGRAEIRLSATNEDWRIDYRDDGVGMPRMMRRKGMGMQNIESRLNMIGAKYRTGENSAGGFRMLIEGKIKSGKTKQP